MNGCLSNPFGSKIGRQNIASISETSSERYIQFSAPSLDFGTSSSSCSSQTKFFSGFFLYCRVLAESVLSADIFSPGFLPCRAIFIASSEFIMFSRQLALVKIYFHLHHMNMSTLNLNNFIPFFFIISDGPSLNHRWPNMGAIGSPWLSMGPLAMS